MRYQATILYGDGLQSTRPYYGSEGEMRAEVAEITAGLRRFHYPVHQVILSEYCEWCHGTGSYRVARGLRRAGALLPCAKCGGSGIARVLPSATWRYHP